VKRILIILTTILSISSGIAFAGQETLVLDKNNINAYLKFPPLTWSSTGFHEDYDITNKTGETVSVRVNVEAGRPSIMIMCNDHISNLEPNTQTICSLENGGSVHWQYGGLKGDFSRGTYSIEK
jgi:hypothetical protein